MPADPTPKVFPSRLGRLADRVLARTGRVLSSADGRRRLITRTGIFLRVVVGLACWAVLVAVPGGLLLTRWAGELFPVSALLLYLPPAVWLIAPALALPPALAVRPGLGAALAVLLALSPWWLFGWRSSTAAPPGGLTVATYNAGQSGPVPLGMGGGGFPDEVGADVVVMQDTYVYFRDHQLGKGFSPPELDAYPYLHRSGEYVTYSKYPFLESTPVRVRGARRMETVAVRHLLDAGGREVVVYNVHLPTPRYLLKRSSPLAPVIESLGPDSAAGAGRSFREPVSRGWTAHCDGALALLARITAETLPTVAAGDFNFPRHGYLARCFRRGLREAVPGGGSGFTFPGTTRNPLSLGRPWVRLDHLFSNAALVPGTAATERGRHTQHLATAAAFHFQ